MGVGSFIAVFLLLPNAYISDRLVSLWPWEHHDALIICTVMFAFFLLQMIGMFGERLWPGGLNAAKLKPFLPALNWSGYGSYGAMSILAFYFIVADLVRIPWQLIAPPDDPHAFDAWTFLIVLTAAFITSVVGLWQASSSPVTRRVDIALANLPPEFDGFTIAQISDLHVGPTIKKAYVEKVVGMVNDLEPDMIALTGDFVDGKIDDLAAEVAPLQNLKSRHGSYYITGNHEYYWGAEGWIKHFRSLGIHTLENEHRIIRQNDSSLLVAGVNDYSTLRWESPISCNPAKAAEGAPSGIVKILLAHQPVTYTLAEKAGFDLQLSGHTHAGQYFPFSLLIRFFQKFYKGLNRYKNMSIYVNSATGYWGPPMRAGVPKEITLISLRTVS